MMRARPAWSGCLAGFALLAGCTVGPDFKPPAPPDTSRYVNEGESGSMPGTDPAYRQTIELGEKVSAAWWLLFRTPEVDRLVKEAIAGNRSLQAARARLVQAREAVAGAASALYPQLSVGANDAEERLSAAAFGLPPSSFALPSHFNLLQVGPTASYSLDLFGGTRRRIEQQSALADYQRDQLRAAYMTLTANTVLYAVQIASYRAQLKSLAEIIELDRRNLDLLRKARRIGSIPDSDVVLAESQLADDQTLAPELEQGLSAAAHALAVLLGRSPGDWAPPELDLARIQLPQQLPVSLPSDLVHQRPDILAAEDQLHAASAAVGVATAQLYPDITLSASLTAASLDGSALFSPSTLAWSVAAGITQPIFDGRLRESQRRAALAAFKAAAADYQQTVLQAFAQVADILQALAHDGEYMQAESRALQTAAQSVDLQRLSFEGGGSSVLGLLDAQRQHQRAYGGFIRASAQRYIDSIQLLVAMGGGWWDNALTRSE